METNKVFNNKFEKIIIVQSSRYTIDRIRFKIKTSYPELMNIISFEEDFEQSLRLIPATGKIVIISSNRFNDLENVKFSKEEKCGNNLAKEIKKINPEAIFYLYSEEEAAMTDKFIDGSFHKKARGINSDEEIIEIFYDIGILIRPENYVPIEKKKKKKKWNILKLFNYH